jgi:hypothetical protein
MRTFVLYVVAGFGIFMAVQVALFLVSGESRLTSDNEGWFLNSGRGVLLLAAAFGLASAAMAVLWSHRPPQLAAPVTLGAVLAMTIVLFMIGPGNLFPVVIAVGTTILGAAVLAGSLLGRSLVALHHRRADSTDDA